MIYTTLFILAGLVGQAKAELVGATYRDFSAGLVENQDPANLQPSQSPSLLNVVIDDPVGSLKPRNGFVQCGVTPSGAIATNIYTYSKSDGTSKLIVTDNTNVWETSDCVTYSTITTAGNSSYIPQFTTARDKLWIVNGSTWPITWDGTTASLLDGRANTPSPKPPACRYPEYWKERVWCGRDNSNQSGVYFSALTDTLGNDLDPSTGTLAWPAVNVFQIDQNGGSPLYGIKAYRNRLYAFKGNGIWEIQFNNDFDNAVLKTYSSVGSRFNTSITEVDGLLHFVGPDGIYAFDGERSVRISDPITTSFESLNQPSINQLFKTWTSQSDFANGTALNTSSTIVVGAVSIINSTVTPSGVNADLESGLTNWTTTLDTTTCANHAFTSQTDTAMEGAKYGRLAASHCWGTSLASCNTNGSPGFTYSILDGAGTVLIGPNGGLSSTPVSTVTVNLASLTTNYLRVQFRATGDADKGSVAATMSTGYITAKHTLSFWYRTSGNNTNNCNTANWFDYLDFDLIRDEVNFASGTFTSDAFNAVTVSTWSTFEATAITAGGSAAFSIKLATGTAALSLASWQSIQPGTVIPGTTSQVAIQWKVDFTTTVAGTLEVDDVTVNYQQGGVSNTPIFSWGWKNRLWVAASSANASGYNDIVLVKSKLPLNSWSKFDLKIGPMARYSDNFYAAASTHSAIYRLDYGTNDNGVAIPWYWQSRDEAWGLPNARKDLLELQADFRKGTAATAFLGYSSDAGTTFTNRTIDMSGSGVGSTRQFVNGGNGFAYRFRVGSSTKDETATILGVTGWARPFKLRE